MYTRKIQTSSHQVQFLKTFQLIFPILVLFQSNKSAYYFSIILHSNLFGHMDEQRVLCIPFLVDWQLPLDGHPEAARKLGKRRKPHFASDVCYGLKDRMSIRDICHFWLMSFPWQDILTCLFFASWRSNFFRDSAQIAPLLIIIPSIPALIITAFLRRTYDLNPFFVTNICYLSVYNQRILWCQLYCTSFQNREFCMHWLSIVFNNQ